MKGMKSRGDETFGGKAEEGSGTVWEVVWHKGVISALFVVERWRGILDSI